MGGPTKRSTIARRPRIRGSSVSKYLAAAAASIATPYAIVSILVSSYYQNNKQHLVTTLQNFAGTASIFTPIVAYIVAHYTQFLGFIALSGASISASSRQTAATVVAASAFVSFVVFKENTALWQYTFLGILASIFLRFKDDKSRILVVALFVLSLLYGVIDFKFDPTFFGTAPANSTAG